MKHQISGRKYELVKAGRMLIHRTNSKRRFYQLKALRDIPEHNVKAGDLGGYVTSEKTLSHTGSCWIGEQAQVVGSYVRVSEYAYVGGRAVVRSLFSNAVLDQTTLRISGFAKITEDATVISKCYVNYYIQDCVIKGATHIYGNAYLHTVTAVSGGSKIYGSANLRKSHNISNCEIYDNAVIGSGVTIANSSIYGNTHVGEKAIIERAAIYGNAAIPPKEVILPGTVIENSEILYQSYKPASEISYGAIFTPEVFAPQSLESTAAINQPEPPVEDVAEVAHPAVSSLSAIEKVYHEVCESIDAYRTDIVKIIKYPVMTDQTNDCTLDMMMALKSARRLDDSPASEEFKAAVVVLEKAFMKSESNARRIASSLLSVAERKKTERAKDLFRVAADEASSEHEKKVAFKQGFKQLEGVLDVPDVAVDVFRVKVGLKEIEGI